ncbi:glycosyltransferase family 4 protein [Calothrix sp. PCC 6303]|uniref:glycosyltransferase family 4 protein n=1 Tax=Calothrix sp. PCC 6303 TaxID=1170562 RepID=UPI0002A029AB|nr:glycosyltransferase family 4 protein [Calothrix sp. PCC 6303]AFZ01173.1 glycosyl transferase group 1 [Calothrix sp. PCC 6303]
MNNNPEKLHILISAYACRPNEGSEPGISWNLVPELLQYHHIWLLTRENNRKVIEAALQTHPIPGLNIVYSDIPSYLRWLKPSQKSVHIHYYLWQIAAYLYAKKLHRDIKFDLIHHLTYVRYWSPSFLSLLPIPFLWGPVGGGESAPGAFWSDFSLRGKFYEVMRNLARTLSELDPFVQITAKRSVLARATTEDTAKCLKRLGAKKIEVVSQLGLLDGEISHLSQYSLAANYPVRFISIGRLLHWKGFHLGLRAFAQANLPGDVEYWIVGDGAEKAQLLALVEELGIGNRVKFWNHRSRQETLEILSQASILVHPSLHESGGQVCLEAMATGRPVICLDLGGPATQVTPQTGIKVHAINPEQAVADLAAAMAKLATDAQLRSQMGEAGKNRVKDLYNWNAKAKSLAQLYTEIVSKELQQVIIK